MTNARGKYAFGFCDRTGFRYSLNQLVDEYQNGVKTGMRGGFDVVDIDHPQNFLGRIRTDDPQSLLNPRPDRKLEEAKVVIPATDLATLEKISVPFMAAEVGSVTISGTTEVSDITVSPISVTAQVSLGGLSVQAVTTYTVTVASGTNSYGSGNKYYIAELSGASPTLTLNEGDTYKFDQSDSSNSGHPLRFSTTANGSHSGGSEYTTGVTTSGTPGNAGAYTQITVAAGAPTLYYYCTVHSGMGGTANTP